MLTQLRFAAIDIGSNAVRLLLASVFENSGRPTFKKMSLTRMPIRLGADTFSLKRISKERTKELVKAMTGFRHLIDAYQPIAFRACATSAMREADNRAQVCKRIQKASGIEVDIIEGALEARLILENQSADQYLGYDAYLYVDVGGGSTEITLSSQGQVAVSGSFKIGTIRLLQGQVAKTDWDALKTWLQTHCAAYKTLAAIGSGGNINKICRLAYCKKGIPLSKSKMIKVRRLLKKYSYEERITELNLRPDRADVIIPGADIYLKVLQWAGIKNIFVPVMGLADGVVRILYSDYMAQEAAAPAP
jgi:exopolyphosphatase/guanosine-5'-triphosphate,3'-diphosphate pyrophosphatase